MKKITFLFLGFLVFLTPSLGFAQSAPAESYRFDFNACELKPSPETCIEQEVRSAYLQYARLNNDYFGKMFASCAGIQESTMRTYCLDQVAKVQEEHAAESEAINTRVTENKQRYAEGQAELKRQGEYIRVIAIALLAALLIWLFIAFFRRGPSNFLHGHKRLIIYTVIGLFLSVFHPLAYFLTAISREKYYLFEKGNTLALVITTAIVSAIIFLVIGLTRGQYRNRTAASAARITFVLLLLAELFALIVVLGMALAGFDI